MAVRLRIRYRTEPIRGQKQYLTVTSPQQILRGTKAPETDDTDPETSIPPDPNAPDSEKLQKVMLPENKEQPGDDAYMDQLIFFGDSTTYGMRHYKVFGEVNTPQVWTPSSGTLGAFPGNH